MPHQAMLTQLRVMRGSLTRSEPLGTVLDELITIGTGNQISYNPPGGAANCIGLYRADAPWGILVNFKRGDLPSFVHELTHASCFAKYGADLINYRPRVPVNPVARTYSSTALPNTPADTRPCTNELLRRQAWHDADAARFLTVNLNNLEAWADVVDFTAPAPWLDAQKARELNTTTDQNRKFAIIEDNARYGVITAPAKKSEQKAALTAEATRKRTWIKERCAYGRSGQGGMGDVHFEYDTVVNQMLTQMYMWGFRPEKPTIPTVRTMSNLVKNRKVPAQYLFTNLEMLAKEASVRRLAAAQIGIGAAPAIMAPAVAINPPT